MISDPTTCPLVIRLFGAFEAHVHGTPLPPLRTRKTAWLLALLALRAGSPVDRAWLAGTLWPESADPMANLRKTLLDLRRAFGAEAGRLHSPTPRTLALDIAGAEVDVLSFNAAIACAGTTRDASVAASLERAIGLYRGPLMEECSEGWVLQERELREQAYLEALETLGSLAIARGEPAAAERYLRRAVAVDSLRESTWRALMRALAARGDVTAAIAVYREFCRVLAGDLQAEPDPETKALFRSLCAELRPVSAGARPWEEPRHNLPAPLTRFIGREPEIAALQRLLTPARDADAPRLITLTGVGGAGKTRLALQVASGLTDAVPDGVWLVELASLADPALVPQAIATALQLPEERGCTVTETLVRHLRPRSVLLVLDNCEHLVATCADFAHTLLLACPHLRILVTSRELIGIDGEHAFPVPPLSLPEAPDPVGAPHPLSFRELARSEAVQLFVERARTAAPAFAMTAANAPAVATICRRLDGLPLAIELAAARMRMFTAEQMAARLEDRFELLTGGSRAALPRHRTLRALIDWSYDLLSEPEQALLRHLSVFAGGWTLETAEAVCADPVASRQLTVVRGEKEPRSVPTDRCLLAPDQVLHLMTRLVDKSLVTVEPGEGEARYRLLETVRQYARERLEEAGEEMTARERHLAFFARWSEQAAQHLGGEQAGASMDQFEAEHDNLRAALAWSREAGTGPNGHTAVELGLRLAAELSAFWFRRGYLAEGRVQLAGMLAMAGTASAPLRARAIRAAGTIASSHCDYSAARALFEEALSICRDLGDQPGTASLLAALGTVLGHQHELAGARLLLGESLAISRGLDEARLTANTLNRWGLLESSAKNYDQASAMLQESLSIQQAARRPEGIALGLNNLGIVTLAQGDADAADRLFRESLRIKWDQRLWAGIPWTLAGLAGVAGAQGQPERAARLFGAAAAGRAPMGNDLPPDFEVRVAALHGEMEEPAFAAAWAEGAAMSLPQAVEYALADDATACG